MWRWRQRCQGSLIDSHYILSKYYLNHLQHPSPTSIYPLSFISVDFLDEYFWVPENPELNEKYFHFLCTAWLNRVHFGLPVAIFYGQRKIKIPFLVWGELVILKCGAMFMIRINRKIYNRWYDLVQCLVNVINPYFSLSNGTITSGAKLSRQVPSQSMRPKDTLN